MKKIALATARRIVDAPAAWQTSRFTGPAWKTLASLGRGTIDGNLEDPVAGGKHWQSSARMLRKRAQHEL